jgi:YHS domain-containing protein
MAVATSTAMHRLDRAGEMLYFCSEGCRARFQ